MAAKPLKFIFCVTALFMLSGCAVYGDYVSPYDYDGQEKIERQQAAAEAEAKLPQEPQENEVYVPVATQADRYEGDSFDSLTWNDWDQNNQQVETTQAPVADPYAPVDILTPMPGQSVQMQVAPVQQPVLKAERYQERNMQSESMPQGKVVNSSVTIYPIDEAMPAEMAQSDGDDFWQVMTIDSNGVNLDSYTPPQVANAPSQPVAYVPQSSVSGDIYTIYFKHGSARLTQKEIKALKSIAADAKNHGRYLIRVTGYASSAVYQQMTEIEKHIVNLNMGGVRATRVSAALMRSGVPVQNIETVSRGAGFAAGDPNRDRRVDVQLIRQ